MPSGSNADETKMSRIERQQSRGIHTKTADKPI